MDNKELTIQRHKQRWPQDTERIINIQKSYLRMKEMRIAPKQPRRERERDKWINPGARELYTFLISFLTP